MDFILNLALNVTINPDGTASATVLHCQSVAPIPTQNPDFSNLIITHTLTPSQVNYGLLTLGVRFPLPRNYEIVHIFVNGTEFPLMKPVLTHQTTVGRINGLTALFRANPELKPGTELNVRFDYANHTLFIDSLPSADIAINLSQNIQYET